VREKSCDALPGRAFTSLLLLVLLLAASARAQTTVLTEGFEGTFPASWSVGDANSAGTPVYWGKVDLRTFGSPPLRTGGGNFACYCAGIGFGGSALSPTYQNSMSAFVSRSVNLAGFSTATLSFWYIIPSMETGLFPPYELFRVKVDGTNVVFSQGTAQSGWTQATISLSAYAGGTHTLTFEFTSDGSSTYEGAYIDDILLVGDDPNDQISEAAFIGAITRTRTFSGQLNSPTDVDMVSFTVSGGQRISFDIDRTNSSNLDSVLRLFDSSGIQLPGGSNDNGRGPGETSSVESYLEYTFTNSGTYYVGISSYPNTNYSSATGTNDAPGSSTGGYVLVVSPGLAGTAKRDGDSTDYPIDILSIDGKAIDPAKRTWIVTHGWTSSRAASYIAATASNLALRYPQDQVLTLDWSAAAVSSSQILDAAAEDAIKNVGIFAADALLQRGFTGDKLNLVGHSWGSYVSDELAERIPGGVNTIVVLDPGEDHLLNNFYDPHAANEVNFAQHSMFSWAFYSADLTGWLGLLLANAGDEVTPTTADEAIVVQGTTHNDIVFMFAAFIANPTAPFAAYFDMNRLLSHSYGPWQANQVDYSGSAAPSAM
jgi:pimeloyl-ACP methyl ester carboxylesterase